MGKGVDTTMTGGAIVIELAANGVIVRPHHRYWESSENKIFEPGEVKVFNTFRDFCGWFEQFFPRSAITEQWSRDEIVELSKKGVEAIPFNMILPPGRPL